MEDKELYEAVLTDLAAEVKKGKKGNQSTIKNLMLQTEGGRRAWITTERPLISDVLKKFPCLSNLLGW